MRWEIVTSLATLVAVLVTIIIFLCSSARESRMRLIDNFNKMYQKTFSLRTELSTFSDKEYGESFYYELDNIQLNAEIQEHLLDYLTEMEDFFFLVVGHKSARHTFERLMSLPLYQRLTAVYGFIIKRRLETMYHACFLNYEKALDEISKMRKIKKAKAAVRYYYVGIRSSDRMYDSNFFQEDIAMFSESTDENVIIKRPNQNKMNKSFLPYVAEKIKEVVKQDRHCQFMFYNGKTASGLPPELHKYFICLNSQKVLTLFNSKPEEKRWLAENGLPVLRYETFLGHEIMWTTLKKRFGAECYVIQASAGGGGIGTFLASTDTLATVCAALHPFSTYVVSAYQKNSISVNTHIFISDKQTVLAPGSIQIVELDDGQLCYRGADFIAFRQISQVCRDKVRKLSFKVANRLRECGYRGVAGVDFLITEDREIYCMEVNPRFQASTPLIDLFLQKQPAKTKNGMARSAFELNEQAFRNQIISTLCFDDAINFSCYYYYKGKQPLSAFKEKRDLLKSQDVIIHDDGFLKFDDESKLDSDSYLFRAVFTHQICTVSPDMTLWLSDNIPVRSKAKDILDLKIALLNQGVRISGHTEQIKSGTYESIDIAYNGPLNSAQEPVVMNCAYGVNLSQYSPYEIELRDHAGAPYDKLRYYGQEIGDVVVERNRLADLSGEDQKILYLATDRLRIKLIKGCEYKNIGKGCAFCNLDVSQKRFTKEEISAALMRLKATKIPFRHILIGGGTCLNPDIWDDIIWLCQFLKSDEYYGNKPISLMSVLPPEKYFPVFHNAGLDEVAFNIEIVDEDIAKALMPGKRSDPKAAYYSALLNAVSVFGIGNVRSALLVGFDKESELIDEVCNLASKGVIPCLSAFRVLNKSQLANSLPPDNETLRRVYDICSKLLAKGNGAIHELGPKCKLCRNNMISI